MHHGDHFFFIVLSIMVAIFGSWTALDLFRRVHSHIGVARRVWLATAAVAMGFSIWAMHFIAMLGFDPGAPVSYDVPVTALSLVLAIGATSGAFFAASRDYAPRGRIVLAGLAMGMGICLMHYVGMTALRTSAVLHHKLVFVLAAFVIAVAASMAALVASRRDRSPSWRVAASIILGLAIVGMHYTGMAGMTVIHVSGAADPSPGASTLQLGVGIAAGTIAMLGLTLLAALYDQRLNVLAAVEAGGIGYWELSLPDGKFQVSTRGKMIFGRDPHLPVNRADLIDSLPKDDQIRREETFRRAVEEGETYDGEYRLETGEPEHRWINIRGRVIATLRGKARRMAGVVLDVTDRRRAFAAVAEAEGRQRILIDELNHRVKNTLSTVQSIARQSAKGKTSIDEFLRAFEPRLVALSRTHNVLTRGSWEKASLRDLLEQELSPYAGDQVQFEGPEATLKPRQTLALGMVFHELATNAAKYGALSKMSGRIDIAWRLDEAGRLELTWTEQGGPAVAPPTRVGFGSRLLRASVQLELGGELHIDHDPAGFRCRIVVPLA